MRGHLGSIAAVAFSPDGTRLATASKDGTAKVWATDEQELLSFRGPADANTDAMVTVLAFSPDSTRIATGSLGEVVKVWDVVGGIELLNLRNPQGSFRGTAWVTVMAFSADGRRLATVSKDRTATETVTVWNATDGRILQRFNGLVPHIAGITFVGQGEHLVVASYDGTLTTWDVASGQKMPWLPGQERSINGWVSIPEAGFSPDGGRLAVPEKELTLKILETASGRELTSLESHSSTFEMFAQGSFQEEQEVRSAFTGVALSPDGIRLATGYEDGKIELRDATSGRYILMFVGHKNRVNAVAFSPDSSRLASVSDDETIKVWGMSSAQELLTLHGFSRRVLRVAFSPNGKRLAAAGSDGVVQVYAMDIHDLLKLARSRVTRDLTPDECLRYFQSKTCPPLPQ
jgi:WD40 repeat protein